MKEPSLKIIKRQIRRYNLREYDYIPCFDKYCKKLLLSRKQQGYVRLSGPYYYLHEKEWDYRSRESNRDVVWAVKKKPGRKYNSNRKRRKEKHRAEHQRKKAFKAKLERQREEEKNKAFVELLSRIHEIRSDVAYG